MTTDLFKLRAFAFASELEREIGIPPGFLARLPEQDDWSFVVKLHALIEAAATHLLVAKLDYPELAEVLSNMELSNRKTGKLAFIKALELVDSDCRAWVQKLSELRNLLVHDVRNAGVALVDALSLTRPNAKAFRDAFQWGFVDVSKVPVKISKTRYDLEALMKAACVITYPYAPKLAIWFGSLLVLRRMYGAALTSRLKRQLQSVALVLVDALLAKKPRPKRRRGGRSKQRAQPMGQA